MTGGELSIGGRATIGDRLKQLCYLSITRPAAVVAWHAWHVWCAYTRRAGGASPYPSFGEGHKAIQAISAGELACLLAGGPGGKFLWSHVEREEKTLG
jgi:hypothetical protein